MPYVNESDWRVFPGIPVLVQYHAGATWKSLGGMGGIWGFRWEKWDERWLWNGSCYNALDIWMVNILPAVLQDDLERFIVHLRLFGKMTYLTLEKLIISAKGSQLYHLDDSRRAARGITLDHWTNPVVTSSAEVNLWWMRFFLYEDYK